MCFVAIVLNHIQNNVLIFIPCQMDYWNTGIIPVLVSAAIHVFPPPCSLYMYQSLGSSLTDVIHCLWWLSQTSPLLQCPTVNSFSCLWCRHCRHGYGVLLPVENVICQALLSL